MTNRPGGRRLNPIYRAQLISQSNGRISGQSATRIADFAPITGFTGLADLANPTAAFLANQRRDRSILHQSQDLQSDQSWATWTGSVVPEFSIVNIKDKLFITIQNACLWHTLDKFPENIQ